METALDNKKVKDKIPKDNHRAAASNAAADEAMTRTPTNSDKSQQSPAGQEEGGSACDLEPKDGVDSKLPKMTKVTNLLKDLIDAGSDEKGATGYDTRTMAKIEPLQNELVQGICEPSEAGSNELSC